MLSYCLFLQAIIRRLHDRNSAIPLHGLLAKNSSQSGPVDRQHIVDLSYADPMSIASSRKWQTATSPWEVVDAVINYIMVVRMIRSYSHEALALLSVLHTVRYFWSVCAGDAEKQKVMLVEICQSVLNKNQERAKCSKSPMKYCNILALAREIVNRHGRSDAKLQSGDVYCGKEPAEDSQAKEIKQLKEDLEKVKKAQASKPPSNNFQNNSRGGNNQRGARANRGRGRGYGNYANNANNANNGNADPKRRKLAQICNKFNSQQGCTRAQCQYFHVCKKLVQGNVCAQSHSMETCPH